MTDRDLILQRLRGRSRAVELPGPYLSRRHYQDLAGQFQLALTEAGGEVLRAQNLEDALQQLGSILANIGATKGIANDQPPLSDIDLAVRWPSISWRVAGKAADDFRQFSAEADIGLTGADAALAETGTVVVSSGPGRSRFTALLPPVHLAFVPESCLTEDIFTWISKRQGDPPPAITLISGPSKTADIEQTLATGVHGPKRFIVVLYED